MQNKQTFLASLLGAGFLMLGLTTVAIAQKAPKTQEATNVRQAGDNHITGVIESVSGTSFSVRLADGTVKTYSATRQIFDKLSLNQGKAIILDTDIELGVSRGGQPMQGFNGRILNIQNNQLTVMLTSGQIRTIPIQPDFAAQLMKLQRSPEVAERMPITGIVNDSSPLSDIDRSPSTATKPPTAQMATRMSQGNNAKVKYSDLIAGCQNREVEINKLRALQDVANNVVRFNRIEVVDINDVLKDQNVQAFQQRHARHTQAEHDMLRDALKNVSVVVSNTNETMKLEQALLTIKVKPESVVALKIPDIYYGKVFVFYDSMAQ